jgi:D-glycero-beta-D-manno-heptose-7-phosphate kinase
MSAPIAPEQLAGLIGRLHLGGAVVVGDLILDEYLVGQATRLSREAPIPVLEFRQRDLIPGGACNPAVNIAAWGASTLQVGVVGADAEGEILRGSLVARAVDASGLIAQAGRITTTKTRIMAHMGLRFPQQVARLDKLDRRPPNAELSQQIAMAVGAGLATRAVVAVSDYLQGLLTADLCQQLRQLAQAAGKPIVADVQGALSPYAGYDLVKCNADEASRLIGQPLHTHADFAGAAQQLCAQLGLHMGMIITRGAAGVTVWAQAAQQAYQVAAPHIEDVYDTVGAGDTVLAVLAASLASGERDLLCMAALSNLAAGIVVRKVGNYAPSRAELLAALG